MPKPIKRILVPTDFSDPSDGALEYARSLASTFGATIDLVHVFDDPFTSGAFIGDGTVMLPLELRDQLLDVAREHLATRHAVHAQTLPGSSTQLLTGATAKRIVEHAAETHPDLIVIGTHGRGGLSHLLLGSVAERVVRTAPCPVLSMRTPQPAPAA